MYKIMRNYIENNYFNQEYEICTNIYIAICLEKELIFIRGFVPKWKQLHKFLIFCMLSISTILPTYKLFVLLILPPFPVIGKSLGEKKKTFVSLFARFCVVFSFQLCRANAEYFWLVYFFFSSKIVKKSDRVMYMYVCTYVCICVVTR